MNDFSTNDINDAKRRVEEMRRRSQDYVETPSNTPPGNKKDQSGMGLIGDILSSLFSSNDKDNSTGLILALIFVLYKEGADNKLIFALLYILL